MNKASPKLRENLASRLVNSESKLNSDQYGKFVSINIGLSIFKRSKEQWLGSFDKQKKTKELFRYVNYLGALLLHILYARHHNLPLIRNRSWKLTIHKDRTFWKNLLENKEMVFKNGVKNIQTTSYNGARTVIIIVILQYLLSGQCKVPGLTICTTCKGYVVQKSDF